MCLDDLSTWNWFGCNPVYGRPDIESCWNSDTVTLVARRDGTVVGEDSWGVGVLLSGEHVFLEFPGVPGGVRRVEYYLDSSSMCP